MNEANASTSRVVVIAPNEAPRARPVAGRGFVFVLVYCSLCTAVIGSLGVLMIPTIADNMDVSRGSAQWILTAALLVGTIATPVLGALSDGPRQHAVMVWALALILIGSLLAATATSFPQLVVGRGLQGLAYAIVPMVIASARSHLPPQRMRGAVTALSIAPVTGAGLSFPLTGILVEAWNYRVAFWVAVGFMALAIVGVLLTAPRPIPAVRVDRGSVDWWGAVLLSAALLCLLLPLSSGGQWGWHSRKVVVLLCAGTILLSAWVFVELRTARPLVQLRSLRHRDVALANMASVGLGASLYAASSMVSQLLQTPTAAGYGFGLALLPAGLAMVPMSAGSQVANGIVQVAVRRVGPRWLLILLPVLVGLNMLSLAASHAHLWQVLVGLFLHGVAVGTSFVLMPIMILRAVPSEQTGSALAVNQVLRLLGGAVGSAGVSGILASTTLSGAALPLDHGYTVAFTAIAAGCGVLVAVLVVAPKVRRRSPASRRSSLDDVGRNDSSATVRRREAATVAGTPAHPRRSL